MSWRINGLVGRPVSVTMDTQGIPLLMEDMPILDISDHYREWVGILEGLPQVDIWRVRTAQGIGELHFVCHPVASPPDKENHLLVTQPVGHWLLVRWED